MKQNGYVVLEIGELACFADGVKLGGITRFIAARGLEFRGILEKFLNELNKSLFNH